MECLIERVVNTFPSLHNFRLPELTDAELKLLSEGCHNIQNIDLTDCYNITDAGLKSLSEGCHNIHNINLSYC